MSLPNNAGVPRIPLGEGAIEYGGSAIRGRERMKQYNEHNDGIRPSLDFRSAEFLPVVMQDTGMDGAPVVIFAGSVLAQANIVEHLVAANNGPVPHALTLANGGVAHALAYGQKSIGGVEDIDTLGTTVTAVSATAGTTAKSGPNKPIGISSGNVYSAAMEKINNNWKLQHQTMIHCDYLVEFGVDNIFMAGGTIPLGTTNIKREAFGVANYDLVLTAAVTLDGIQTGDCIVVNPYLPGSLISISDLEKIVADVGADVIGAALEAIWGGTKASAGWVVDQKVGKVEKRQSVAHVQRSGTSIEIIARDAYAESLNMVTTASGFGLSGKDSGGIDAHLHTAYMYASGSAVDIGTTPGAYAAVSTIWVNLQF